MGMRRRRKEGSKEDGTNVNEDWETVKTTAAAAAAQETPDMNHLAQISPGGAVAVACVGRSSKKKGQY